MVVCICGCVYVVGTSYSCDNDDGSSAVVSWCGGETCRVACRTHRFSWFHVCARITLR